MKWCLKASRRRKIPSVKEGAEQRSVYIIRTTKEKKSNVLLKKHNFYLFIRILHFLYIIT